MRSQKEAGTTEPCYTAVIPHGSYGFTLNQPRSSGGLWDVTKVADATNGNRASLSLYHGLDRTDKPNSHPYLHISREREVLPEGMPLKPVIGQDSSQVWVIGKENAIHIPYLENNNNKAQ